MKKLMVIGGGVSGVAAARLGTLLVMNPEIVADGGGSDPAAVFRGASLIVVSPGVKPASPLRRAALASGIETIGELEFGFRHFPGKTLGITGTNGKTTTTELVVHLLLAAGVNAVPAGNIGFPLSDVAADCLEGKLGRDPVAAVEVSSFQLELAPTFAPLAAALINLDSDHLDRYPGGMAEYAATKRNIFRHVAPENRILGAALAGKTPDPVIRIGGRAVIDFGETQLRGSHNLENLTVALELVSRILPEEALFAPEFQAALRSFRAGRHRIELVSELGGVRFVNDSKATNPASTVAALRTMQSDGVAGVHLLLGGLDKDMDFSPLLAFAPLIRHAYLIGECRAKIAAVIAERIPFEDFGTDFARAVGSAKRNARPGEAVLLAPGCASMDMFKNYIDRGDRFCELVKQA